MRTATMPLTGVNGLPRQRCAVVRPSKPRHNAQLLADPAVASVIARGAGRSYGDAALNDHPEAGHVVAEQVWLDRLLALDEANATVTCEAGVTLERLIDAVLPRGFFPLVTPGTQLATVGGCLAADVHGKNHHADGSYADMAVAFDLLTPDGQVRHCSRDENAELFWATLGGMGLTGTILRCTLRLKRIASGYIDTTYRRTRDVHGLFDAFEQPDEPTYSVAWIDCLASGASLGRGVLIQGEHTADPSRITGDPLRLRKRRVIDLPVHLPGIALNRFSVKAFNAAYYGKHKDARTLERYDTFFYPLDAVRNWMRGYGRRGFVQYQSVLPPDGGRAGIVKQLEAIARSGQASFLAVLKKFGGHHDGWLSFPKPGYTLALDLPNRGDTLRKLVAELDAITLDHGGRVYLAKDCFLDRATFDRMYPEADRFRGLRSRIDPQAKLNSSLARRLGLVGVDG